MRELRFALIREGTSDDGLIAHIRTLLIREGIGAVLGASRPYKGSVLDCLTQVWEEPDAVDLIFVHRDSDSPDFKGRREEILAASATMAGWAERVVPVVPVQELEAWLLTSEEEIRTVVGRPTGREALDLPKLRDIEKTASPKELLQRACLTAKAAKGARHQRERKAFGVRRAALLDRLDIDGNINQLPAWARFKQDLSSAAAVVQAQLQSNNADTQSGQA